jgi:hypothetical protein
MAAPYQPPTRACSRWRDDETTALIDAWKPLFKDRRHGKIDGVAARYHSRVRSSCRLVADDWRVVAAAVNSSRDAKRLVSHRTHQQCKNRIDTLTHTYGKEFFGATALPWRFFTTLRPRSVS